MDGVQIMTNLPIETQAALAITVGLCAWLIGALAWEMAQQPWHRWVGRAAIGAGVLQLAAFANFAASRVEFLQFVQKGEKAHDTGDTIIEWTTERGHKFRFDGRDRRSASGIGYSTTMLPAMGRTDGSERGAGCCGFAAGRAGNRDAELCPRPKSGCSAMATSSAGRRICACEQCTCQPCLCDQLQAAAN